MTPKKFYAIYEIDSDDEAGFISNCYSITTTWDALEDAKEHTKVLKGDHPLCTYVVYECTPVKESK